MSSIKLVEMFERIHRPPKELNVGDPEYISPMPYFSKRPNYTSPGLMNHKMFCIIDAARDQNFHKVQKILRTLNYNLSYINFNPGEFDSISSATMFDILFYPKGNDDDSNWRQSQNTAQLYKQRGSPVEYSPNWLTYTYEEFIDIMKMVLEKDNE